METLRNVLGSRPAVTGCRWVLGAVFLLAALAKIVDPAEFARDVHNFRLVPVALENLVAIVLPWIELVAGTALVSGVRARSGALLTTALLAVFTVAVVAAVARGLDFECGCFGTGDGTRVGLQKVLQNLALLAVGVVASLPRR